MLKINGDAEVALLWWMTNILLTVGVRSCLQVSSSNQRVGADETMMQMLQKSSQSIQRSVTTVTQHQQQQQQRQQFSTFRTVNQSWNRQPHGWWRFFLHSAQNFVTLHTHTPRNLRLITWIIIFFWWCERAEIGATVAGAKVSWCFYEYFFYFVCLSL